MTVWRDATGAGQLIKSGGNHTRKLRALKKGCQIHKHSASSFLMQRRILSAMTIQKPHKPFSMIREFHLADWFTLANAVCGTGALFSMLTYLQTTDVRHVYFACGMVFAALVFDVLDGRIARWRQKNSVMGRELDSLADVISFGVAPAVIGVRLRHAGLIRPYCPDLFCRMRSIPPGALQRYGRGAVRRRRQSEVLRRNSHPDVAAAGNVDVLGCLHRVHCASPSGSDRSCLPASLFIRLYCFSRFPAH